MSGTVVAQNGSALGTGNITSVLLGDVTGSANTKLSNGISSGGSISRNVIVQAGNTGIATIAGSASGVNSSFSSGTITLGSLVNGTPTGHGLTFSNNSNASLTIADKIMDPSVGSTTTPGLLTIAGPSGQGQAQKHNR